MNTLAKFDLQKTIFTAITFKEIIDWKTLIKMLYDDNNIVRMVAKKNNRGELLFENEESNWKKYYEKE